MIILKPIETAQTLNFIGRFDYADKIVIRDEQDNTEIEINEYFYMYQYYICADLILNLKENRFYNLSVYTDNEICYRDKIFCTNQEIGSFSINKDEYIQKESNNDYITI